MGSPATDSTDGTYYVAHMLCMPCAGKELQLLSKVSGVFRPGVLTRWAGG